MELRNSVITTKAQETLDGNWGLAIGAFFVAGLISSISGAIPFIGFIGNLILGGPIALGLSIFSLKLCRKQSPEFQDIFEGFNNFGNALVLYLLQVLYVILWSLLLIIPGIIAAIGYSQSFYILSENPDMNASDVLKKSQEMMDGYKWQYFFLGLRFFGWALLCLLTFGIGFLWLIPYINISYARFYMELKEEEMDSIIDEFHQ